MGEASNVQFEVVPDNEDTLTIPRDLSGCYSFQ